MGISCKERPSEARGRQRGWRGRGVVIKISTTVDDTPVLRVEGLMPALWVDYITCQCRHSSVEISFVLSPWHRVAIVPMLGLGCFNVKSKCYLLMLILTALFINNKYMYKRKEVLKATNRLLSDLSLNKYLHLSMTPFVF